MNWKTELKLTDLDPDTAVEVVCKRCGLAFYQTPTHLRERLDFRNLYLDEVEYALHCTDRFCRGGVRISLIYDDKNEGFIGGLA